ncbi:hypothetical protein EYF80_021967 [Liparis tanakae]|uniref:Uncharacterized protein n=1 Tax=Liparis tanakae TaxID=230148 RepID=A0A4Z2HS49_9TELE|nr:hypothetical protein EYF80_021967 [Liparis tanakae]
MFRRGVWVQQQEGRGALLALSPLVKSNGGQRRARRRRGGTERSEASQGDGEEAEHPLPTELLYGAGAESRRHTERDAVATPGCQAT